MRKIFVLLALFIYSSSILFAQKIDLGEDGKKKAIIPPRITVDTTQAQIVYSFTIVNKRDSLDRPYGYRYRTLLNVGKKISSFTDEEVYIADSVTIEGVKQGLTNQELYDKILKVSSERRTFSDKVYVNYPAGKITTRTMLAGGLYYYEENIPAIKWKLTPDTATILGHKCKKATCELSGRDYEVWYTPNVPLNAGPWKFKGLPGLIIKASDSKREVYFECLSVHYPKNIIPLSIPLKGDRTITTSKKEFFRLKKEHLKNPAILYSSVISSPNPANNRQLSKERKETFIELVVE